MIPVPVEIAIWSVILGCIGYLFIRQSSHEKRISLAENNVDHTNKEIKEMLTSFKTDMKDDLKAINEKLDMFIHNELQFLKGIRMVRK